MGLLKKLNGNKGLSLVVLCLVCLIMGQAIQAKEVRESNGLAGSSVAGLSVALNGYYNDLFDGAVTSEKELEIRKIMDPVRATVLEDYKNIGVANVQGYLNVREEPSKNGKVCGKMIDGDGCEILEVLNGWYHISSGEVNGYVSADYILTGTAAQMKAMDKAKLRVEIATDGLRLRKEPNTDSSILTFVGNQERYVVLDTSVEGWIKIAVDNLEGYVSADYVKMRYALTTAVEFHPISDSPLRVKIVEFAMQYLGNRYVWGGESLTNGVDCSGFTMKVMEQFGVKLPHYSGSQANCGVPIDASKLRPGDLIFYAGDGRINHVAFYIGNGQILHAANSNQGIIISNANYRPIVKCVNLLGD